MNLYYLYNCRLYRKPFIIQYEVYNIHIIIILNYIFIYQNLNFLRTKQFYFFLHFPGSLQVTEFINRQGETSKTYQSKGIFLNSTNYNYNLTNFSFSSAQIKCTYKIANTNRATETLELREHILKLSQDFLLNSADGGYYITTLRKQFLWYTVKEKISLNCRKFCCFKKIFFNVNESFSLG